MLLPGIIMNAILIPLAFVTIGTDGPEACQAARVYSAVLSYYFVIILILIYILAVIVYVYMIYLVKTMACKLSSVFHIKSQTQCRLMRKLRKQLFQGAPTRKFFDLLGKGGPREKSEK